MRALMIALAAYFALEAAHSALDLYIRAACELGTCYGEEF